GENGTIVLIGVLGADEDAYTMLRLGIEIPDVTRAEVMNHEAMRRQRVQRLLASGIIGEMHFEARGGKIKTVLVEEWFTRRLHSQQRKGWHQYDGRYDRPGATARQNRSASWHDFDTPTST